MDIRSFRQGESRRGISARSQPDDSNLFMFLPHVFSEFSAA